MKFFGILMLLAIAVGAYFAFQYHFIVLDDGVQVLKKTEMSLNYTIVDGRGATNIAKIITNPTLLKAGINEIIYGEGKRIRPKKNLGKAYKDLTD